MKLKEFVYQIIDGLKIVSDDSIITESYVAWVVINHRNSLLYKSKQQSPDTSEFENYMQDICLDLFPYELRPLNGCYNGSILIGKPSIDIDATVPKLLPDAPVRVFPYDSFSYKFAYVDYRRFFYTGHNEYLKNIIYFTISSDGNVLVKSQNPEFKFLRKVVLSGVFEDWIKAGDLDCDNPDCDYLDREFYVSPEFIPELLTSCTQWILGNRQYITELNNDSNDDDAVEVTDNRTNFVSNADINPVAQEAAMKPSTPQRTQSRNR